MKRSWKWRLGLGALALAGLLVLAFVGLIEWSLSHPAPVRPVTTAAEAIIKAKRSWENLHWKKPDDPMFIPEGVARFEPYIATDLYGYWIVRGTIPPGYNGEILVNRIRASDGAGWITVFSIGDCLRAWTWSEEAPAVCAMLQSDPAPQ